MRTRSLFVSFVILLAGCGGGGGNTAPRAKAKASATPPGFSVRTVSDPGFSVAVPQGWKSIDAAQALDVEALGQFERENPALRGQLKKIAEPGSPLKLLAYAPQRQSAGFATNLNVLVFSIPADAPYDKWTAAEVKSLTRLHLARGPSRRELQLAGERALRLDYHARFVVRSRPLVASIQQYFVKKDAELFLLTYTTLVGSTKLYAPAFEASARTFRLTG